MLRSVLLLIAACCFICSHAQDRLIPGYIVLDNGDTLNGHIQLKGYRTAPEGVYYSKENAGQPKVYSVWDCKAFGTAEKVYQRWIVKMDMSMMNKLDFVIHNEDSVLLDTFFLQQVYQGRNFGLFKYYNEKENSFLKVEDQKPHFFLYDKNNETMQELILKYVNPNKDRVDFSKTSAFAEYTTRRALCIYRDQLYAFFDWNKQRKLRRKVDYLEYSETEFKKIIAAIESKM